MDASGISQADTIKLYSSFVYMTTDALNCKKTSERTTKDKTIVQHNCDFHYKRKIFELDDITWYSCLCRFIHPSFHQLMVLSKQYEKGILPDEGGMLEQSNLLIEHLELLDYLKNLHKEQQHKENERKQNGRSQHRPPTPTGKRAVRTATSSRPNKSN